MTKTKKMKREYYGEPAAIAVASKLINNSVPFEVEPFPCNVFEFTVQDERSGLMPAENVGRDALVSNDRNGEPSVTCKYCGRNFGAEDEVFEGDPCPSDNCPSHDMKEGSDRQLGAVGADEFEAAMIAAGYPRPKRSPFSADAYLYERDQDRFVGWMLRHEQTPNA